MEWIEQLGLLHQANVNDSHMSGALATTMLYLPY